MNESRARRYQRRERILQAVRAMAAAAALGLVAFSPIGQLAGVLARSATSGWPVWVGAPTALALFVLLILLAAGGIVLPARVLARPAAPSAHGPVVRPPLSAALVDETKALAVLGLGAFCAAAVVFGVFRAAGPWWWLAGGGVLALAGLLGAYLAPAFVAALSGARPVRSAALAEQLAALARRAGVPVNSIEEIPVADRDEVTAFVAGLGRGRRVFLASTLVRDWSPDEIAVVVAHELGHHRRHDLLRTLLVDGALVTAALGTAAAAFPEAAAGGLEALPGIAGISGGLWMASAPIRYAQSRHQERQADAFALGITGGAGSFRAVVRRLGARRLVDERPSTIARWLTARHPSVAERLAAAEAHLAAAPGGASTGRRAGRDEGQAG